MTTEIWKPVLGFEFAYSVSNLGRVYSARTEKVMKPGRSSNGYLTVVLSEKGKRRSVPVQWLVAETFIGARPQGRQVLHNDGDKTNNCVSNLRYGTRAENARDVTLHGRRKWSVDQIREIRRLMAEGANGVEVALRFGMTHEQVYQIKNGKAYAYV